MPCWLVFDAKFRRKFSAGGLMPTVHTPEHKVPGDWWDHYVFRAATIEELAAKIHVPVDALKQQVANNNAYAKTGIDPEFGKGMNIYDQFFGDPTVTPNPNIGPIDTAPYYAVPINAATLAPRAGCAATRGRGCSTRRAIRSPAFMPPATSRARRSAMSIRGLVQPSVRP
jgi:3-oxosteroid 1-dehydrogenase